MTSIPFEDLATIVFVLVDDWYQADGVKLLAGKRGRKPSFSDRSRYYWPVPEVQAALALLSQFAPVQYSRIRSGRIVNRPRAIILDRIGQVLDEYAYACEVTPHS